MTLCITSDYHGQFMHINPTEFNPADVFIFCGDWTASRDYKTQEKETIRFFAWLNTLPFTHKLVIAGNHDFVAEKNPTLVNLLAESNDIVYLCEQSTIIDGITFYGTPYTPMFMDWAFMKTEKQLALRFENIPFETNVLITHGPSFEILDKTTRNESVGSEALQDTIAELPNLKLHCFGHIHESYGIEQHKYTAINASQLTYNYKLDPKPIYITI